MQVDDLIAILVRCNPIRPRQSGAIARFGDGADAADRVRVPRSDCAIGRASEIAPGARQSRLQQLVQAAVVERPGPDESGAAPPSQPENSASWQPATLSGGTESVGRCATARAPARWPRVGQRLFNCPAELVPLGTADHRQVFDQLDAHEPICPWCLCWSSIGSLRMQTLTTALARHGTLCSHSRGCKPKLNEGNFK